MEARTPAVDTSECMKSGKVRISSELAMVGSLPTLNPLALEHVISLATGGCIVCQY